VSGEIVVAVIGLAGIVLTGLLTAIATTAKVRRELESDYDLALRNERLAAYRELWKRLQPLAKYFRPEAITYRRLKQLGADLRAWYFETGGIYLTPESRDAYFELMDGLRDAVAARAEELDREVGTAEFERLRDQGSALRTALVGDARTRRESALAESNAASS
jgi:hypothetical protein